MNHSYEEIRNAVIEIISEDVDEGSQYQNLIVAVSELFDSREGSNSNRNSFRGDSNLSGRDENLVNEVFWALFREGITTLGLNHSNPEFPWFRVSEFGKRVLKNQNPYFFHDVTTYETLVKGRIPNIDETTLVYLKEAVQAFKTGCVLSSTVMIGVSVEHSFLILLDTIEKKPTHQSTFSKVYKERGILRKVNAFKKILDNNPNLLPSDVKEDLDTQFASILAMIRSFRNESGHPSGRIISREQCYILLQIFIPCCEKIYQMIDVFI